MRVPAEHDPTGAALTMRAVQQQRPSLCAMSEGLATLGLPLVIAGDEDERALQPGLILKSTLSRAGLAALPRSGRVTNLEKPKLFNRLAERFLSQVGNERRLTVQREVGGQGEQ